MSRRRSIPVQNLAGTLRAPGDKSISHRALMLGSMCVGETTIEGLLEGEDVLATMKAMRALGATISRRETGGWSIRGVGVGGLRQPDAALDMGNSGTGVRLLLGLVATHPIETTFTGDRSLCTRPMGRVIGPLEEMGAQFSTVDGVRLPITVSGAVDPLPFTYEVPVPSAQVKSAVLLAALNTPGTTTVIEPVPTRDHTENMLRYMGAQIDVSEGDNGSHLIALKGPVELKAADLVVPGDPSSAAFPVVAALITPGSALTVENVMVNPLRTGLFETLQEMGGNIRFTNRRKVGAENVANIEVASSNLTGIDVPAERAPSMIDEYPILAVAAAAAKGTTVMKGLAELRIKETDRLDAIAAGLSINGIEVKAGEDHLTIRGADGQIPGGGLVATHMDHRIAMSFLVLGCAAGAPVDIDEDAMIATSFPEFFDLMTNIGARMVETEGAES